MDSKYKYEVALSFAGEQRDFVEKIALYLKENGINVFYDYFEQVELWGKDLTAKLEEIYTNEARYCVIFISKDYAEKEWTCHECAAAAQRMLNSRVKSVDYILPVRFDNTKLPAVFNTTGYIDANIFTPLKIGEMLVRKITGTNSVTKIDFQKFMEKLETSLQHLHIYMESDIKAQEYNYTFTKNKIKTYKMQVKSVFDTDTQLRLQLRKNIKEFIYYNEIPDAIITIEKDENTIDIKNFGFFNCHTKNISIDDIIEKIVKDIKIELGV